MAQAGRPRGFIMKPPSPADTTDELKAYGALSSQVVDVSSDGEARVLSYLDLRASSAGWRIPVVVENAGRPCVHVFDARGGEAPTKDQIGRWCWRVTLRGDGAWVGVLEPGRLRVFRADIHHNEVQSVQVAEVERGNWALPKFLNDVSAGRDDIARRRYLTKLLQSSARDATALGLSETDALSLVGRGLFWRFLVDRKLLVGLQPEDVCTGASSWEQCLDNKARALRTFQWLDETFNGGLLPFEDSNLRDFDPKVFSSVLGNISHGATETGQLRLPTDWQEVNFSYVPVGLLSEVYEAFAHQINSAQATAQSIHYTPAHLVDFIVSQALAELTPGGKPRVLDPAAGAGVFLVTAFRKLVEREWEEKGERPKRRRIREILNKQIVGFDTDARALRLAELALYLTAIELDPKPKPLTELQFKELRGHVLLHVREEDQGSLGAVPEEFKNKFDLVVGNPPWTAKPKGGDAKKVWIAHTKAIARARLGDARAEAFDFPDTNKDLPFVWRALDWAKEGGRIALIVHARWLFGISDRATQARNDLLQAVRVTGILNASALRLTSVWPEVDAPWCVIFATNETPKPFEQAAFQFVSPVLDADRDSKQARIRIDWFDAQTVLASEVVECPWTLKARFRGNRLAVRVLQAMQQDGERLGGYLRRVLKTFRESGDVFRNGYQIGGKAGKQVDASRLRGLPDTKDAGPLGFVIDAESLPKFSRKTLLFPRDRETYRAPLLLMRESIPVDRLAPRASRADRDVAFHESFHGVSFAGVENADGIARYLQLYFQSSSMVFATLLIDGRYGIERDAIHQESLELLPVVPLEKLTKAQKRKMLDLSQRIEDGLTPDLADKVDEFIVDTFGLSDVEQETVRDTLETMLPTVGAKRRAVEPPSVEDAKRFVSTLEGSLNSVLSASGQRAVVHEDCSVDWSPWRVLRVDTSKSATKRAPAPPLSAFLEEADAGGASMVTIQTGSTSWMVGLLTRYAHWTPTRARLLASDLLSERALDE